MTISFLTSFDVHSDTSNIASHLLAMTAGTEILLQC